MLETVAIPILMKAVEFLFGEGGKIMEERRERRKAELETNKEKPEITDALSTTVTDKATDIIQSKEAALSQPIAETTWLASEARVDSPPLECC